MGTTPVGLPHRLGGCGDVLAFQRSEDGKSFVAMRDAKNNEQDRQTLLEQGGKIKVPCLRIEEDGIRDC